MATSITPSKRQLDRNFIGSQVKRKWQKSSGAFSQNQMKFSSGSVVLRFLCPVSKSGSIIGKGGATVTQIRQETGAKVKIEDTIPGCDERIVTIVGSDQEVVANSEDDEEIALEEENIEEKDDDATEPNKDHEDEDSVAKSDTMSAKGTSSVQRALLLLFERLVQGDVDNEVGNGESENSSACIFRLLVLSNQIGCILGKGGCVIKQMAAESGAQIRIIPKDKFPSCATGAGELVQVSGGVDAVRRAVRSISQQLLENHRDNDSSITNMAEKLPHSKAETYSLVNHPQGASHGPNDDADSQSADPHVASKFHESNFSDRMNPSTDTLSFRLWCPAERVGGVIGKGGTIIKTIQQETHCEIRVLEGVPDTEDRIIFVSGIARPEERISAVQDAVLRVQSRIVKAVPDSKEQNVMARILVPSNQIGCLLGKGGSVIAEMRKSSTAHIRIMGKDQIPKCAAEDEEVVQINGDFDSVQEALLQITTRLQQNFFRNAFPSLKYSSNPALLDQGPPFPSFMGRRELSPTGVFSNFGPTFHKFNSVSGVAPYGSLRSLDDRQSFMHNINRPGIHPFLSDRKPWGSRGFLEDGGPLGLPDFVGAPHRRIGLGGGSQSAIITNTTVEVVVPHSLVPEIYGEDGECLRQIRQISDAKITITEAKPGAVETVIIISGTPEQTHAAQSLIQAFVMCGSESS